MERVAPLAEGLGLLDKSAKSLANPEKRKRKNGAQKLKSLSCLLWPIRVDLLLVLYNRNNLCKKILNKVLPVLTEDKVGYLIYDDMRYMRRLYSDTVKSCRIVTNVCTAQLLYFRRQSQREWTIVITALIGRGLLMRRQFPCRHGSSL